MENTEAFQAISTPNYPNNYPDDANVTFIVYSPDGTLIRIYFLDFVIEETDYYYYDDCEYDEFIIYDGEQKHLIKSKYVT